MLTFAMGKCQPHLSLTSPRLTSLLNCDLLYLLPPPMIYLDLFVHVRKHLSNSLKRILPACPPETCRTVRPTTDQSSRPRPMSFEGILACHKSRKRLPVNSIWRLRLNRVFLYGAVWYTIYPLRREGDGTYSSSARDSCLWKGFQVEHCRVVVWAYINIVSGR